MSGLIRKLDLSKSQLYLLGGVIIFTLFFYALLHEKYKIYDGDDTWSLSMAYAYAKKGIDQDIIFYAKDDPARHLIFLKTYHILISPILDTLGWTRTNSHLINLFLLICSSILWFFICRKLEFSDRLAVLVAMGMMLFPVYFQAANHTRPDIIAFLMTSISFLLFMNKRYFFSGLMLLIAFETHTMGMMATFYIIAYFLWKRKEIWNNWPTFFKTAIPFGLGLILGGFYFYWIHRDYLTVDTFVETLSARRGMGNGNPLKNYIFSYFFQPDWYRHWWELILLIYVIVLYLKNKLYKQDVFVWIFLLVLVVSIYITGRPNRNYMVYLYPSFLILIAYTFERLDRLKFLCVSLMTIFTIYLGTNYVINRNYDFDHLITETKSAMTDKTLPVVGMPNNWYAAQEQEFYPLYNLVNFIPDLQLKELYLIRNDYLQEEDLTTWIERKLKDMEILNDNPLGRRRLHYDGMIEYFEEHYDLVLLKKIDTGTGDLAEVYHCMKKAN